MNKINTNDHHMDNQNKSDLHLCSSRRAFFNFKLCKSPRTSYNLERRFNVHGSASTDGLSMSRTANRREPIKGFRLGLTDLLLGADGQFGGNFNDFLCRLLMGTPSSATGVIIYVHAMMENHFQWLLNHLSADVSYCQRVWKLDLSRSTINTAES